MLTAAQCVVLAVAVSAGKPDLAQSLPAVALVESSLGVQLIGDDGQSLGAFQMTIETAQEVLTIHPKLRQGRWTDSQVRMGLLTDVRWAAQLAAFRLRDLIVAYGWERGQIAYNAGVSGMLGGNAKWRGDQVREAMREVKRLRRYCE